MAQNRTETGAGPANGAPIRYAVIGLGYIAQAAVLPAFRKAGNSELAALVSDDPVKLDELGRKYRVKARFTYDGYDECLRSGAVDAVFIALPNNLHREYAVRAAEAGIHVLCEKPMAVSVPDCQAMIDAARDAGVKLMIAYRLHFEPCNLDAVALAQAGELGTLRLFSSTFTMQVAAGNIRLRRELGGGPLWDIGIYCINAARYLFRAEPYEVFAAAARPPDPRFAEVDETVAATLRFPGDRLAQFVTSFGTADASSYTLIGTRGKLRVDPAYEHAQALRSALTVDGKTTTRRFPKVDQFAAELLHFSECVQTGAAPGPSGEEGLIDVRIIEALHASIAAGRPVRVEAAQPPQRPRPEDEIRRRGHAPPELVHAENPSGG